MSGTKPSEAREHARAAVTLEVHYRSVGSFLVSYSVNISQSGLFLETAELLPVGAPLRVRFAIRGVPAPSDAIETEATVAWIRETPTADGQPRGMGLAFYRLDEQIGAQIDAVVRSFTGVKLIAVAAGTAAVERLARQLCNTLTCSVLRCTSGSEAVKRLGPGIDLVVLDLDSLAYQGLALVEQLCERTPRIPLLVMARDEGLCRAALSAGVTVLDNPPPQRTLRAHVLALVGRPAG